MYCAIPIYDGLIRQGFAININCYVLGVSSYGI